MERLVLIPVDDSVVFPNMSVTLAVDVGDEERVVLVPRKGDEFASVGTVAEVGERIKLPGGARAALLNGFTAPRSARRRAIPWGCCGST